MSRRLDAVAFASSPDARPRPTRVRLVHLGVGAFHRSHQAWYTAHADPRGEWGIHAFTGRSARAAEPLRAQDGLYTVTTRGRDGDRVEVIANLIRVDSGDNTSALIYAVSAHDTAVVTLTITESGYRLDLAGHPDMNDEVMAEISHHVADTADRVSKALGYAGGLRRNQTVGQTSRE